MVEVIGLAVAGLLFVWWQLRDVARARRTREQEEAQAQEHAQQCAGISGQPPPVGQTNTEQPDPQRPEAPRT